MTLEVTVPDSAKATVVPPVHPDRLKVQVGPGTHTWRYRLPAAWGERVELSLDSPVKDVAREPQAWEALRAVLQTYLPGVPIDTGVSHMAQMTLTSVIEQMPVDWTRCAGTCCVPSADEVTRRRKAHVQPRHVLQMDD